MRVGLVAAILVVVSVALPTMADATTCAGLLSFDEAAVVLDGIAQPGPTAPDGTLASPATFEVLRYVKGTGPARVQVHTGTTVDGAMVAIIPGSIAPRAGETWRILATDGADLSEPIPTVCTKAEQLEDAAVFPGDQEVADDSGSWSSWALLALPVGGQASRGADGHAHASGALTPGDATASSRRMASRDRDRSR